MSDKEMKNVVEEETVALDEIEEAKKASFGDPSEVPDPVAKTAAAPGKSKKQGDASAPMQGSSEKPKTKMAMLNAAMQYMSGMSKSDLQAAYTKMMGEEVATEEEVEVVEDKKIEKITREDINVAEDIAAVFAGSDLSEEFKEMATEIFEAAVVAKVNEKLGEISEQAEAELAESTEVFNKELVENVDSYLDYVVEQWMDDNKLAVETGIRGEIAESFIGGLKDLFEQHYIEVPEEKVDVVEELANKVEELEAKLNESIEEAIELKKRNEEFERAVIFSEEVEGLTETQVGKLESLCEAVDFADADTFRKKIQSIRESYFAGPQEVLTEEKTGLDDEPFEIEEETDSTPKGAMGAYVASITRTAKKR